MELNTPRTNPYAELNKKKEDWKKESFSDALTVVSAEEVTFRSTKVKADQWHIVYHERFMDETNESQSKALYALSTEKGEKAYLETTYGKYADETTDAFLRNVDASDDMSNISQ